MIKYYAFAQPLLPFRRPPFDHLAQRAIHSIAALLFLNREEMDSSPTRSRWSKDRASRPSAKFDARKKNNAFGKNSYLTPFSKRYSAGAVPIRIDHGAVKMRLKWEIDPVKMNAPEYCELLVLFAEGLREVKHPYVTVARQAYEEMLGLEGASEYIDAEVVKSLIMPLRKALSSKSDDVFIAGVNAVMLLSRVVGALLNKFLSIIVVQIARKAFVPKFKDIVSECLSTLGDQGGRAATEIIRKKVPTYSC